MPAIIGGFIKVVNMSTGGVANFGDTAYITPKDTAKAYLGGGAVLTGDFGRATNLVSNTNTLDIDAVDNNVDGVK